MLKIVALAASLLLTVPAAAMPTLYKASAGLFYVDPADPYGFKLGDVARLWVVADPDKALDIASQSGVAGLEAISLSDGASSLTLQLGSHVWHETDDLNYGQVINPPIFPTSFGLPEPLLLLRDGKFYGLDFFAINADGDFVESIALDFVSQGFPPGLFQGGPDRNTITFGGFLLPEVGSLWGLLGGAALIAYARRARARAA